MTKILGVDSMSEAQVKKKIGTEDSNLAENPLKASHFQGSLHSPEHPKMLTACGLQ